MNGGNEPKKRAGGAPQRWIVSIALIAGGLVAGGVLAGTTIASAASSTSTASGGPAATRGPSAVLHGPGETLLTGTTAAKVKAAALDAVRGGTILRVETDSDGSPYEAHVRKPDGSVVTVKVDNAFTVTSTESGLGAGAPSPSGDSGA